MLADLMRGDFSFVSLAWGDVEKGVWRPWLCMR